MKSGFIFRKGKFLLAVIIASICYTASSGQILKDTASMQLVKNGIASIYGFRFEESDKILSELNKSYSGHPVCYLMNGLSEYWRNFPLTDKSPSRSSYEKDLLKCIEICEQNKDKSLEVEYLLGNLSGRGLILLFYTDNDLSNEVIPIASSTYKHLKKSFNFKSECTDLLYFTGVYNYYRDAYPRIHPVYKPVALLFPPGNSETGIRELEKCASEGFVLNCEAYFMLFWIMMNYENNFDKSLYYIKKLVTGYPDNPLYKIMYLKNLLLLKNYTEAERVLNQITSASSNDYYKACSEVINGILQEKRYSNFQLSKELYLKGVRDLEIYGSYGNEFRAYAYFGLSRISNLPGEKEVKRKYHREGMNLISFKKINFDN